MPHDITTGEQTVTATGAVTGSLDVSGYTVHPTIKVQVQALTAGATARIAIEDTADSTPFGDASQAAVFDVQGPIALPADVWLSVTPDLTPSLRFGAANCKLRANVLLLTGSSPSLTLHAFVA